MIVAMTDPRYATASPPPPPYSPYPGPPPRNQLRRSRSNRCLAGVAGGLAEYLGVEATAIRVGFVLLSVVFLAGFGGVLLYVLAWALIPGEGSPRAPGWERYGPGQAWQPNGAGAGGAPWGSARPPVPGTGWDQSSAPTGPPADRAARSWALVLGAIALALIWSFGFAPWWRSGAPLGWLVFAGIVTWFFLGHRRRALKRSGMGAPGAPAGGMGTAPASGAGPMPVGVEQAGVEQSGVVPGGDPHSQEAADWAAAQAAAERWAQQQLEAAGVPQTPPAGAATAGSMAPGRGQERSQRPPHFGTLVAVLLAGLVLLVVVSVIGITIGSGASLVGGVGDVTDSPGTQAAVRAHYALGLGRLEVDLSQVRFSTGGKTVEASVGAGELVLVLPRHTIVSLDAKTGVGGVHLPSGRAGRVAELQLSNPPNPATGSSGHLTVDAKVGLGVIDVRWG
jgi:phage shock protein PspC (stress-responsive transcriptional regulator)